MCALLFLPIADSQLTMIQCLSPHEGIMHMPLRHFLWHYLPFCKKFYSVGIVNPIISTEYFEYSAVSSNISECSILSCSRELFKKMKIIFCQIIKSAMEMEVSGNSISRHINNKWIYFGMSKKKKKYQRQSNIKA